ncbi:MAG: LysR family transcriptional regulator [Proteobacteria bacterium]|nr:LysR family transcriptional regulator [Pseudomonadota bacterium]
MEMHQIRYFLAVAQELNFTRAAQQCNVAQPSLTRAIKLMEEELGGALLHRERANTHLTELGRTLLPHLQQIYDDAHAAKRIARDFTRQRKAKLKLGIMCTVAPTHLVEFISAFHVLNPDVEIELADANARILDRALLDGELEIAIYCLPDREPDEKLHVMPLFCEPMMIAVAPQHPLAAHAVVRGIDLDGHAYLARVNCEFAGYAFNFIREKGADYHVAYKSERDDWILAMIRSGLGFGFLPQSSITDPALVARPLVDPEFSRVVNLVTVRGRPHSPAVGALVREAMRTKWPGHPARPPARSRAADGDE